MFFSFSMTLLSWSWTLVKALHFPLILDVEGILSSQQIQGTNKYPLLDKLDWVALLVIEPNHTYSIP